jgi:hypothetical protein
MEGLGVTTGGITKEVGQPARLLCFQGLSHMHVTVPHIQGSVMKMTVPTNRAYFFFPNFFNSNSCKVGRPISCSS